MNRRKHSVRRNFNSMMVVGAVMFFLILWFGSSIIEVLRLTQLKRNLNAQITEKQEASSRLDEDIAQIGSKAYIERIARNYLGLYYPDEQIVIPVESKPQSEDKNLASTGEEGEESVEIDVDSQQLNVVNNVEDEENKEGEDSQKTDTDTQNSLEKENQKVGPVLKQNGSADSGSEKVSEAPTTEVEESEEIEENNE